MYFFIKRNSELSDKESKWDTNYKDIKMLFDEYHGELKTCKKFENPKKNQKLKLEKNIL